MRRIPLLAALGAVALSASHADAADPRLGVRVSVEPAEVPPDATALLQVELDVPEDWHLWSFDPGPGPLPLRLTPEVPAGLTPADAWYGPEPHPKWDEGFGADLLQYGSGRVRFELPLAASDGAIGQHAITVRGRGQICSASQCLDQRFEETATLKVASGAPALDIQPSGQRLASLVPAAGPPTVPPAPVPPAAAPADLKPENDFTEFGATDLSSFLLMAFLFGLGALVTPCVLPAVPLTISFFSKYRDRGPLRVAGLAATYASTMVLFFTVAGVLVSLLFGVTKIQSFAAHPVFNLGLAGVLVFFALNMMGLFEIQTPQWLLKGANRLESRYGRAAHRDGGGSVLVDYLVVAIAAITATTVFFTCTVGFVGLVLVAAARGDVLWPTVGMLAFSSAFALPFFLLALFPSWAQRIRGAGGPWLSATRVTLGFIELAAAFKFVSNADLVWNWQIFTRDLVLAFWVPIFAVAGFYLLGKIKFVGESAADDEGRVTVMQSLAAVTLLAFSTYLAVGLIQGRAFGGWLDGWLPPTRYPGQTAGPIAQTGAANEAGFAWHEDLETARAEAEREGRVVFVNYTGYTCTNCRYMEEAVFPRPEVASLLRQMVLAELYTDGGLPRHEAARADQIARFGTAALPFYAVERPDGSVIAKFPSSTNDPAEFAAFLRGALAQADAAPEAVPSAAPNAPERPAALGTDWGRAEALFGGSQQSVAPPGRWTLVNFWATWCAPCREELQGFLVELGQSLESSGGAFRAVAMDADEDLDAARAFAKQLGLDAPQALRFAPDAVPAPWKSKLAFEGNQLPFTALISPAGEVVWHRPTAVTKAELEAALNEYVGRI